MKGRFALDLKAFRLRTLDKNEKVRRAVVLSLFRSIIESTPVGNPELWKTPPPPGYVGGRARGNWQTSTGTPPSDPVDRVDPQGTEAADEVKRNMGKNGETVSLTNNLPYIHRLEYDGWSSQAPNGMVRINVKRVKKNLKKLIRAIK